MIYPATTQYLDFALQSLKDGDVIVYPTDTLYGFGVDATSTEAIQKLNALKGRSQPLSIILKDVEDIPNYGILPKGDFKEIKKLLPGPYTILITSLKSDLSPLVCNTSPKIGIRIPDHFFPLELSKAFKKPIITTSINRHGNEPLNDVTQVEIDFPNVDIFEDNKHKPSKGSTIIDMSVNPFNIVRQGDSPFPK